MKKLLISLVFTFCSIGIFAQSISELIKQSNQLLTDGHDYPTAISNLEKALAATDISPEEKVRANYDIADAKLRESQLQVNKLGGEVPPKYREYIYQSVDHLLYARENVSEKPGLKESIELRINSLENTLTRNMMQLIREKDMRKGSEKDASIILLLRTCQAVQKLNPSNYSAHDYQGQAELTNGDSAKALASLQKAVSLYEKAEMTEPDAYAGYMYYRVALLFNNYKKDRAASRTALEAGLNTLVADREKLVSNIEMKQVRKDIIIKTIDEVEGKIDLFLVDLLIRDGAETPEQKALIEETIKKHPDNMNLMFQYAKMISADDPKTAAEVYDQIIAKDPNNAVAVYNAGVLYYNIAANGGNDPNLTRAHEAALMDQMRYALEYFKRAVALGQKAAIPPILQIAQFFGDDELYQQYAGMQ